MTRFSARRAALLGVALVAMGCDLATFALDPKPRFEETWNLPATSNQISVADLLPAGNTVSIYSTPPVTAADSIAPPDSIAFALTISPVSISRSVGADCGAPCTSINGTNAVKPAFTLQSGSSTPLPSNVVAVAMLSGQIVITLTNNMSFDPLQVKNGAGAQGFMVIVVRSNSLVIGKDSVEGAIAPVGPNQTKWPAAPAAGSVLTRTINLTTGTVTGNFQVDVTLNSPQGDHLEPMNSNGALNASAAVNNVLVGSVSLNVPGSTVNSGNKDTVDLSEISGDAIKSAGLEMTFANPFAVTGNLTVQFKYGPNPTDTVYTGITLPSGNGKRTALFNETQIQKMLGHACAVSVTGNVTSSSAITVTPKQFLSITNRLLVTVRTPSGGN